MGQAGREGEQERQEREERGGAGGALGRMAGTAVRRRNDGELGGHGDTRRSTTNWDEAVRWVAQYRKPKMFPILE